MDIEDFPRLSIRNREQIMHVEEMAGCYFCIRAFSREKVFQDPEWTDDGDTILCPNCGIDALVPGCTDVELLRAANERWFCGATD